MNEELTTLEEQLRACRLSSRQDSSSPCHHMARWKCQQGDSAMVLTHPSPVDLADSVDILLVGINPRCSQESASTSDDGSRMHDTGKTYWAYLNQITGQASGAIVAGTDLVLCGTPTGRQLSSEDIVRCRARYFDKVVMAVRPVLMVAVGSYASSHLYWNCTREGRAGEPWTGVKRMHGRSVDADVSGHQCRIVFVRQPSSRVSRVDRALAAQEVGRLWRLLDR